MFMWALWALQYPTTVPLNNQCTTWYPDLNANQFNCYSVNQHNYYSVNRLNNQINTSNHSTFVSNYSKSHTVSKSTPTTLLNSSLDKEKTLHTTMEADKYYFRGRFGDYSIHFQNREAIPIQEVEKKFSQFGEISSCRQTGDGRGLVFVNYKTEESAIKCAEALQNHPTIKLRLKKQYVQKNDQNNYASESKKYNSPPSLHESNYSSDKDCAVKNDNEQVKISTGQSPMNVNNNDIHDYKIDMNNEAHVKTVAAVNNNTEIIEDQEDNQNCSVPTDLPELIPALKKNISTSVEMEEMIKSTIDMSKEAKEIIEAQEIIVANIEDNYGIPAILHLLEKYDPICASPMQLCKPYSIRYCHVYFNNVHQAEAAEREFDEFEWSENKKLIVLRVNTLASLALIA